eukprot:gnl/TRDRNA2_/TRDRNA2_41360_c0_seq1.p1 gnl/TRDRNA2_/TRDRNA2_41360_c0~~gnl/TRDRNA2_/TRDRNA2_41360_c0_seq1.p1  ORF type:complete len:389 (+),score=85.64 gnl/TRDRNA2_/TRDRNA2_41360_c0_seq1:43-1209(+)
MFGGRAPPGPADTTRFYRLLEVERSADAAEIRKAYRRLAAQHHPDKGGDPEKFKEVSRAYEVLSDTDMRRLYDERGEDGLQGGMSADPSELFEMLFGGGRSKRRQRTKDIVHPLPVTLEQLYLGCTKKLAINREVVDQEHEVKVCGECAGAGVKGQASPLGMIVAPQPCTACRGTGKLYKIQKVREVLEVFIEKGAPHGHKILFAGKADECPGLQAGNVTFILQQQEHADFRRKDADLFLAREIGLLEALTGFSMEITTLDKRKLLVRTSSGEVVQPLAEGTGLKAIKGEGMPTFRQPFVLGNLFLILSIRFPDSIDPKYFPKLREALPGPTEEEVVDDEDVEVCYVEDMDPLESAKQNAMYLQSGSGQAHEEDERTGGLPGANCPHQ